MAATPTLPFPQGTLLAGKYRVDRLIGEGGMAHVYRVTHEGLAQPMALKVLREDATDDGRFLNEARIAARLRSEHVVRVFDVGRIEDGRPCFAMELLEGTDLAAAVEHGPLDVTTAVDYTLQALDAIAEAHARGLVHRDLKPANLFLARKPSGERTVKVLDFGISKNMKPETSQSVTTTKAVMGTPLYMAPEQIRNARYVDAQSDLWSVGVILYELLEGRPPFAGETYGEVFAAILQEEPAPFTRPIPPELVAIIRQCLARDRKQRPASALDLGQRLAQFGTQQGRNSVQKTRVMLLAEEPTGDVAMEQSSPRVVPADVREPSPSHARTLAAVTHTWSSPRRRRRAAMVGALVVALAFGTALGVRRVMGSDARTEIAPAVAAVAPPAAATMPGAAAPSAPAVDLTTPPPRASATAVASAAPPRRAVMPPRPRTAPKPAPREETSDIVLDRH